MPFFEHDGIQFHYRESGDGVPFIFQHGLGADANQTFELFQPPAGMRLLTFDSRGHGETRPLGPEEKISIKIFSDDLLAFMRHLGIERAIIGGISMGAAIALHFALTHRERVIGLVLSRPAWLDESRSDNLKVFATIAEFIRKYGAWEGAQRFQQTIAYQEVLKVSPDNANSLLGQFAHPRAEETVAKLERIPAHIPKHSRAEWQSIRAPTLVLANQQDAIHPFDFGEVLAREIPGARLVEITPKSVSKERHTADVQRALENWSADILSASLCSQHSTRGQDVRAPIT
jgi:pimeloyl-ACP methyl ester carboxylesterase